MKLALLAALAALTVAGADKTPKTLAEKYSAYAETRRYCVSREVVDGKIITKWYRNGKPDWILPAVETNAVKQIAGVEQKNPLQDALVKINEQLQTAVERYLSASNRAAVAETRIATATANIDAQIAEYEKKRDDAKLPTTKAIYQAVIDLLNDIKSKLEALLNKEN